MRRQARRAGWPLPKRFDEAKRSDHKSEGGNRAIPSRGFPRRRDLESDPRSERQRAHLRAIGLCCDLPTSGHAVVVAVDTTVG
jgi:hypothetical protein